MPRLSRTDQTAKISTNEANRRRVLALAELRELERDAKKGALLPAADVRKVWADRLAALRDRALALPDRLAARLAGRTEIEVRAMLREELEDMLRGVYAEAH